MRHSNTGGMSFDTFEGERIGPKMRTACNMVGRWRSETFGSRNQLAKAVGPNGSQNYGYQIVNRCMWAGLLKLDSDHPDASPTGEGAIVLTEKGDRYLDWLDETDR